MNHYILYYTNRGEGVQPELAGTFDTLPEATDSAQVDHVQYSDDELHWWMGDSLSEWIGGLVDEKPRYLIVTAYQRDADKCTELEVRVARLEEHERFIAEATANLRRQTFEDLIKALEAMVE